MGKELFFKEFDWVHLVVGGVFLVIGIEMLVTYPKEMGFLFATIGGGIMLLAKESAISINKDTKEVILVSKRIITRKRFFRTAKYSEINNIILKLYSLRDGFNQNDLIINFMDNTQFKQYLGRSSDQSLVGMVLHQPKPNNPFLIRAKALADEIGCIFKMET